MDLQKIIKDWVSIDNSYKKLLDDTKIIRNKKNSLNEQIFSYFNDNNYSSLPKINISDGKLEFIEQKQYDILTYAYLEKCLNDYYNDKNEVNNLITFIKQNRKYNINKLIKRTYKNN